MRILPRSGKGTCVGLIVFVCFLFFYTTNCSPQSLSGSSQFDKLETLLLMRDGVRLHTAIYAPKSKQPSLPIILIRTPYGISQVSAYFGGYQDDLGLYAGYLRELAEEGYIFVFQDIRGRYGSDGSFVNGRPPRRDKSNPVATDEGTDTYDTIEWLINNVPGNNGRVGMTGISYQGWLTVMAMLEPHPALRAVSPQAAPADGWIGDDDHHNGAFRLSYNLEYVFQMESSKENADPTSLIDRRDTYRWYLELGPLSNVNAKYFHGKMPTWENYVRHPDYDAFWQEQAVPRYLERVTVPALIVAGWWDPEDFYGPMAIYEALTRRDAEGPAYLVVGPWNHGGWARTSGRTLGEIDFGSNTAEHFRTHIQAQWFAYWLKDKGTLDFPKVQTFEAGSNRWRQWNAWPPNTGTELKQLYFHPSGKLSFNAPGSPEAVKTATKTPIEAADVITDYDEYSSDPAHPVPYRHQPIETTYSPQGSGWRTWLVEDQRFVANRSDVLYWESEPLKSDFTLEGKVSADLFASTSGTDTDWVVKLIDVYPETYSQKWNLSGWELMVSAEIFRARYRNSFERAEPVPANEVVHYTIDMHTQNYTFKKDHRIAVQVQSTWFPLYDVNPQKYVANIFEAQPEDYQKAVQRIYHSTEYPSHLNIQASSWNSIH